MPEFAIDQIHILLYYIIAGVAFCLLLDIFKFIRKKFNNPKWLTILTDTLFWLIFIFVIFTMNFNILHGEIRGLTVLGLAAGVTIYFLLKHRISTKKAARHKKKQATSKP